jgi:anti-anti-sigma factor
MPIPLSRWFEIEQVGDVTVVRFTQPAILEDEVIAAIREQLFLLVDEEGRRLFVLNFANVRSLASRMLGQLVALHKKLQGADGRMVLCRISPFLYEFFETAQLPRLLYTRGDEQEAVQALAAPSPGDA